jgi:glutathione synthase/RimK-type ligase-like ATP-grasp enzyme
VNEVSYIILSSTYDFSTDLICCELEQRRAKYLRLNRDNFSNYKLLFSLEDGELLVETGTQKYRISPKLLKSVYFRAPVFLRGTGKSYSLEEQLFRNQWSSFIRNLMVFNDSTWINHPVATYRAENKLYQLKIAREVGMTTPVTFVGNSLPNSVDCKKDYIVKALDAALFYDQGKEMFTYSTIVTGEDLIQSEIQYAPIILQECLKNKIDVRVTVIGDKLYATSITCNGENIEGDWRKHEKEHLVYSRIVLPNDIQDSILNLMKVLELHFGGVDLAIVDGNYFFIEINPTGEWGWLTQVASLPIDKQIVDYMINCGAGTNV